MYLKLKYLIKASVVFIFMMPALTGCDTPYDIVYEIENLTDQTITVETGKSRFITGEGQTFTIAIGATVQVLRRGGVNARDYVPPDDRYNFVNDKLFPPGFEKFDIYCGDVLLPESICRPELWEYRAKKLLGVYNLCITKERVDELKNE